MQVCPGVEADIFEKMRITKEQDPENLYLHCGLGEEEIREGVPNAFESSAAQSQTTLVSKLETLQCHFTWDLEPSKSKLLRLRDQLKDIGTEEGNRWLGHIHNLQGFVEYKMKNIENAKSLFNKAAEAFCQLRNADEGPWLVVNYGNLAWLHHHLGDEAESEAYLSKVDALMNKYPSPSQDELHPEIYAEKAWSLMELSADKKLAADYFQRAIRMQPDMVEWNSSYFLVLVKNCKYNSTGLEAEVLEKMRIAKEQDPENLYLAVYYLEQRAKKGEKVDDEARELAQKVLRNPVSSYSGIKALIRLYRNFISVDEATDLVDEALEKHPDECYLKRCAALCYKWKIICKEQRKPKQSVIDRAITLHKEVISLYPHSSLLMKINLANIYAKSGYGLAKAEQIYQELLERDLEPADKQMLYYNYAKYLHFDRDEFESSLRYNMKAAEIPHQSLYRDGSIRVLEKIKGRMRREIQEFLRNLQEPQCFYQH
ncbi:interferon-induced protein with tetratricopeptide repeats 1-like [Centropristis striata]|uniref:interferon-induced protein with tetratricopeptide repeats 1-like n=1 Tax=Centropristis striata TaxID=184440 RepID=UPI0027E2111B|nr:interferon-induced protein with tetratricopeptide repeats 1-like [Centropristis striata]